MNKKAVIITGSTGGLGSEITRECCSLLSAGEVDLVLCICRDSNKMQDIAHELSNLAIIEHDSAKQDPEYDELLAVLSHDFDYDITLIHTSFSINPIGHIGTLESEEIVDNINVNILDFVCLINSLVRFQRNSKRQLRVVNIDSGAAYKPLDGWGLYCSSKAYVNMFLRCCVNEGALQAVSYEPGVMNTRMQEYIRDRDESECSLVRSFVKYNDEGLLRDPAVIASDITQRFICSWDGSSFNVGHAI